MLGCSDFDVISEDFVKGYFVGLLIVYDIVINNVGFIYFKCILEFDSVLWVNDIQVNLVGIYYVCKYVLIVFEFIQLIQIFLMVGFNVYKDWLFYCVLKVGVIILLKSFVVDGYNFICLCFGVIDIKFCDYFDLFNNNMMICE